LGAATPGQIRAQVQAEALAQAAAALERFTLINNEKAKLKANSWDRVSTFCYTIGVLGPYYGWFSRTTSVDFTATPVVLGSAILFLIGFASHKMAQHHLDDLR
jgi:hypothetical protein